MSGILGGLMDVLFGKPKAPKADFSEIEKLMRLSAELNRTNQNGILSQWNWSEGPNGWSQNQTIAPEMQPALDNFYGRQGEGPNPQLQDLLAARFQSMMGGNRVLPTPERRQRPQYRQYRDPTEGPPPDWRP